MHNKPRWLSLTILILAAAVAAAASAAGLGAGSSAAVLGQPLDFQVQVRLDADEALAAECVSAEVSAGERVLPPGQVRTRIDAQAAGSARIRVLTLGAIEEPVIGIRLSVGCSARLTRHYVVLVDPPAAPLSALEPAALPIQPDTAAPVAAPEAATSRAQAVVPPVQQSEPSPRTVAGNAHPAAPRAAAQQPSRSRPATPSRRAARQQRPQSPVARAPAVATPRLMLDAAEPVLSADAQAVEQAIEVVAQAASAARVAAQAASAADARIASLEQTVEQLRREAGASRDLAAQLRERLSRTEGTGAWMLPLMLLALGLAVLAAVLAWRLGRAQSAQRMAWSEQRASAAVAATADMPPSKTPTAPIPFVTSEIHVPSAPTPVPAPAAGRARARAWPQPAPSDPWATLPPPPSTLAPDPDLVRTEPPVVRTQVMPAQAHNDDGAPRDVSIEELIDLEQQAEFFVVLGQDDAAIDLLMDHLRSTGGGSPLPYLKLLEIHHRRPDREAYERLRARFNHRFNAYAPEWGADLQHGRSLDDYAGVVPRLQAVWPRPLDAMAELEALLFRKSRGELFDLPAYREVLFLYSVARDLLDHDTVDAGEVDLLLPMADAGEFSSTSPAPLVLPGDDAAAGATELDDRPTAPLDFDLSLAEKPTSIFDPLDITQPFKRR